MNLKELKEKKILELNAIGKELGVEGAAGRTAGLGGRQLRGRQYPAGHGNSR